MSFTKELEKTIGVKDSNGIARLWIIYYNTKDEIREIKSLYNPEEYKGARVVYTDKELLKKLKK
tara:strand:+ start:6024 stop:6215 length:192 start_codon:yes stop_codon:yes gene_type:complete